MNLLDAAAQSEPVLYTGAFTILHTRHVLLPRTPELAAAIEGLYAAFKGYPLPKDFSGCPCCHSPNDHLQLYSAALRELRPEALYQFAGDALLVWGDLDGFRHFLPRIFEISVLTDDNYFTDRPIVFEKLMHGEWRHWPEPEQKAVQQFLMTVWRTALEIPPEDLPVTERYYPCDSMEDWLCALAGASGPMSPYLEEWLQADSASACWNLAAMITRTGMSYAIPRGINAFWGGHMDQAEEISAWLRTDGVRKKLESGIEKCADEAFAEELMAAWEMVRG
ncbi:MAG TPA: hypothetical protein VHN74_19830 [Candidatus Angelobacter sp.]|nr:hypothetical protein [Candidatus Angelobacter sp.]